jgi:hypothetical protein
MYLSVAAQSALRSSVRTGSNVKRRGARVTTVIDNEVGDRVRALAIERSAALSRIIEEALVEYLAARPPGTQFSLRARLPREPGRPSKLDSVAETQREQQLRKRTGRPMTRRPAEAPVA